ncbi:hypothetical protein ACFQX6_07425 [Streptosporangium lutulentum]
MDGGDDSVVAAVLGGGRVLDHGDFLHAQRLAPDKFFVKEELVIGTPRCADIYRRGVERHGSGEDRPTPADVRTGAW